MCSAVSWSSSKTKRRPACSVTRKRPFSAWTKFVGGGNADRLYLLQPQGTERRHRGDRWLRSGRSGWFGLLGLSGSRWGGGQGRLRSGACTGGTQDGEQGQQDGEYPDHSGSMAHSGTCIPPVKSTNGLLIDPTGKARGLGERMEFLRTALSGRLRPPEIAGEQITLPRQGYNRHRLSSFHIIRRLGPMQGMPLC